MPPKKGKGKEKPGAVAAAAMMAGAAKGPPPKLKKPPPPPACFSADDIARFKEMFKEHDEEGTDMIPLNLIPLMLRKLGFNPKTAEIKQLFAQILEDEYVDTVLLHEWYLMIEAKMNWGDDFEPEVTKAMATLGHAENEAGICNFQQLRQELETWGEPLQESEFKDWIKLAIKDKTLNMTDGSFNYVKFIENMNNKDAEDRFIKEPINYFKMDQKTLAAMAIKKVTEEREEQERKEAEKRARDEAKRLRMIADGLLPPD